MNRTAVLVTILTVTSVLGAGVPVAGADGGTAGGAADGGNATAGADLVTLEITVVDTDGNPVGRANVNVTYDGGGNETRTFSNGEALVDVPRGVSPSVRVSHDDYVRNFPVRVGTVDESTQTEVTVYERASATIEVDDGESAVEGARVVLKKDGDLRTVERGRTDADGAYRTDAIEAGNYTATVVREGYLEEEVAFAASGEVSASVTLERARTNVDFTVLDGHFENATPVTDAEVTVSNDGDRVASLSTDDRGEAATVLGVNAEYTVTVDHPDYETVERQLELGEQDQTAVTYNITRTPSISVAADEGSVDVGGTVRVRVTDEYGQPVGDAVVLRGDQEVGQTDANGVLSVPVVEAGEFEITAEADGLTADPVTVEGVGEETTTEEQTTPGGGDETESQGGGLPGFTAGAAVVALSAALAALRRRD